jgi:hypothetical protein
VRRKSKSGTCGSTKALSGENSNPTTSRLIHSDKKQSGREVIISAVDYCEGPGNVNKEDRCNIVPPKKSKKPRG